MYCQSLDFVCEVPYVLGEDLPGTQWGAEASGRLEWVPGATVGQVLLTLSPTMQNVSPVAAGPTPAFPPNGIVDIGERSPIEITTNLRLDYGKIIIRLL